MEGFNVMKIDSMIYRGYKYVPKDKQIQNKSGELINVSKKFTTPSQFKDEVEKLIARKK